jgi:tetratricopeptide (TPR) repeat protein
VRAGERLDALLAAAAFLAGAVRGWSLAVSTDASFHLTRVGQGIFRSGLHAFTVPPGGEGAPVLGAVATGIGALFASGPEDLGRPAGAVLLGACAAALVWTLARRADRLVGALGAALLVAPPAFAATFPARPDAALGGLLLLLALADVALERAPARAPAWAWAGGLATPVAWPAAAWLQLTLPRGERRRVRAWLGLAATITLVAGLSAALPAGHRGEVLRGLLSGWDPSPAGWASSLLAARHVWIFGVLLAVPLVVPGLGVRGGRRLVTAWALAALGSGLLSGPGVFRETTAALAPGACFLLALAAHALPDGRAAAPARGPRRAVIAAFAVPLALLALRGDETGRWRRAVHGETARDAQIAAFVRDSLHPAGPVIATRTGALTALSGAEVRELRATLPADGDAPAVVVFADGLRPGPGRERALFECDRFLPAYAPLFFRRGPTNGTPDAAWVRRAEPASADSLPADYARLLENAWRRRAAGSLTGAQKSFQAACGKEPDGLGLAHEGLGLILETLGNARGAETLFLQARQRDPTAVRARAHLADRALSRGKLGAADSLIAEAMAFTDEEAEIWGLRARLLHLAGDPRAALVDSERAVYLNPLNARLLANHGILLWETGDHDGAREFWRLAVRRDRNILRYLGDFEVASDDDPAPPLSPIFTFTSFAPRLDERPGQPPAP